MVPFLQHRRTIVVTLLVVVATIAGAVVGGRGGQLPGAGSGEAGRTTPTSGDPWTARDQWLQLRGSEPSSLTAMTPPTGRIQLREHLLPRYPRGRARRISRDRPDGFEPVAVVLHATGGGALGSGFGTLGQLQRYFARGAAQASAHYAIDRAGRVLRMVPEQDAAFHVATPGWNDISIGIELLNDNSGVDPYPAAQLTALTHLVRDLGTRHAIPVEAVVRHSTVQSSDRRDPVAFPWRAWVATLHAPAEATGRG